MQMSSQQQPNLRQQLLCSHAQLSHIITILAFFVQPAVTEAHHVLLPPVSPTVLEKIIKSKWLIFPDLQQKLY